MSVGDTYTYPSHLVGKTIERMWISKDSQYIVMMDSEGQYHSFWAEGDCCSESWFAEIIGVVGFLNNEILSYEEVLLASYNNEQNKLYSAEFKTRWGTLIIVFRNNSNGYYGGWIQPTRVIPEFSEMTELKEDW